MSSVQQTSKKEKDSSSKIKVSSYNVSGISKSMIIFDSSNERIFTGAYLSISQNRMISKSPDILPDYSPLTTKTDV